MEKQILRVAVLGAHSNFKGQGFRQKDLRFIAELFTNWMDIFLKPNLPRWHNTQALRYLDGLVLKGAATSSGKGKSRKYTLTRLGLLQLVHEIVDFEDYADIKHTILVVYFIRSYRKRILQLIDIEGSGYSKAARVEIQRLFNSESFLDQQIEQLKLQIERLKLRIEETMKSAELGQKLLNQKESIASIIQKVSSTYPYELESQKPMEELLREIDPEQRAWEVIHGNRFRGDILWGTQLNLLNEYLKILKDLKIRLQEGGAL